MLKRLFAIGAALTIAFSISVVSFADNSTVVTDNIDIGFPFYGDTKVRQDNTVIYQSNNPADAIICSDEALSLNGSGGTIIFDFYPRTYTAPITFKEGDNAVINIPYMYITVDTDQDRWLDFRNYDGDEYNQYENPMYGFETHLDYVSAVVGRDYNTKVTCKTISSGQYVIEGSLIFANNAIGSLEDWNAMHSSITATVIDNNNNSYPVRMTSPVFEVYNRNGHDFVNFRLCLDNPYSGEYNRIFFQITSKSTGGIPGLTGFLVNTGNIKFQKASSIQSLSMLLGSWFDKLISEIKANAITNDDDAANAEQSADHESVSEAQSQVSEIEAFESGLNSSIEQSVSNIDFTIPSYFGAALGAVGFIFGGLFSDLGGYQIVITIPLILGIMLILIGRGTIALGRIVSANARADRRSVNKGGEA